MGYVFSCLRWKKQENYVFNHAGTEDIGYISRYQARNSVDKRTLMNNRIRVDSGFCSVYLERLPPEQEKVLQKKYRFLQDNLMAKCILPILVQHGVLSEDDDIEIRKRLTDRARTELLLSKLVHSKPGSFAIFLDALHQTKQTFIVLELERKDNIQHEVPKGFTTAEKEKIKRMIEREELYILEELKPDKFLGYLVEHEILSIETVAEMTMKSRREKAQIVLNTVSKQLPEAFNVLMYALKQTKSDLLARRLRKFVFSNRDSNLVVSSGRQRRSTECESRPRIQMRATFYDGEDMLPLIQAEASAVERINKDERENVRKTIFRETGSKFMEATSGSLILHLIPYSKRTYDKLLKYCKNGGFENLLKRLLSDENTRRLLPQGPVTVKLELHAIGVVENSGQNDVAKLKDKIIEEIDTVVDEIDPMDFKKSFVESQLLTKDYFHQLNKSYGESRPARAAEFIEKILELGDKAVLLFMETIERNGQEYLLGVLKKDMSTVVHDNDELIANLELQNQESTECQTIPFFETKYYITVQDPMSCQGTHQTISPETMEPHTEKRQTLRSDISSDKSERVADFHGTQQTISLEMFNPYTIQGSDESGYVSS